MIMRSQKSDQEKEALIKTFFSHHSYYYENLCYNVYYLSMLPGTNVLTIDEAGVSHINLVTKEPSKKYYDVLILNEFSPSCNDVIMHIDAALNHLYELLHEENLYYTGKLT